MLKLASCVNGRIAHYCLVHRWFIVRNVPTSNFIEKVEAPRSCLDNEFFNSVFRFN